MGAVCFLKAKLPHHQEKSHFWPLFLLIFEGHDFWISSHGRQRLNFGFVLGFQLLPSLSSRHEDDRWGSSGFDGSCSRPSLVSIRSCQPSDPPFLRCAVFLSVAHLLFGKWLRHLYLLEGQVLENSDQHVRCQLGHL